MSAFDILATLIALWAARVFGEGSTLVGPALAGPVLAPRLLPVLAALPPSRPSPGLIDTMPEDGIGSLAEDKDLGVRRCQAGIAAAHLTASSASASASLVFHTGKLSPHGGGRRTRGHRRA